MFMTANDDKAMQRQAIEVGCVGYLLKPFAVKLLMNILAESKIDKRTRD
jgi:CheY-like chemotaxis protein